MGHHIPRNLRRYCPYILSFKPKYREIYMRRTYPRGAAYADKPSARRTRVWMRMVDEVSEESEDVA